MAVNETPSDVIAQVCNVLASASAKDAASIITAKYPFNPIARSSRSYTDLQSMKVFVRDGFVDRYSGQRLVFPGTLKLLSVELGEVFPYHLNWKLSECHMAFWELFPTIDHVVPIARGGDNGHGNLACTSMIRNAAKANWTLEELNWTPVPAGSVEEWDGLTSWCLAYVQSHPAILDDAYIARWCRAAEGCGVTPD